MLVALAVFAVLGVMSSQMLTRILDVHDVASARGERLSEVQRGMDLLQRDVLQLVHREVRDELGDPLPALRVGASPALELTRTGWRNPLWLPRSELQRVAYGIDDEGRLVRYYWRVLDRAEDSEPVAQVLINDVTRFEVSVLDSSGNQHPFWPLVGDEGLDPDAELVALQVALEMAPFGEIVRVWDVPPPFKGPAGAAGDAASEEGGEVPLPEDAPELAEDLQ